MDRSNLKVMTFIGTRPEIIRLSRVMSLLDEYVNHITVHTGQNYDYELNDIFYSDLELRKPNYYLNVNVSSLGATVGDIIRKSEHVLVKEKPDAVLILGDTNSCLAAYMAKRLHIPIFHMEAGNRCFDLNVPEETNRRIIDHIADFNLVYTEHARRHLLSEGISHRRIYITGSPLNEVLNFYYSKIVGSNILSNLRLEYKKYFLVSIHREENVDSLKNLKNILLLLNKLAKIYNMPIIVSTHPRTRKNIKSNIASLPNPHHLIHFSKPFGFVNYNNLQMNAKCVISDSGSISEESAILNFPAITIRNSIERPEAIDYGTIILSGLRSEIILDSIRIAISEFENCKERKISNDYQIKNTSWRVLKIIMGLTNLKNLWGYY